MKRPSTKTQKVLAAATTPVAVLLAGALVYQASYAAFTGQTRNSGNEWSTGTVTLTDDDAGAARFQVGNMLPGDSDTKCIKVIANASVDSTVRGYTVNPASSPQGLENRIMVTIRAGSGGSFADCTGFTAQETIVPKTPLSALAAVNNFDSGIGGWNVPSGNQERTYELSWEFDTSGMTQPEIDRLQGARTGIDMQWEMRTQA